jgi:hypothetical protein
MWDGLVGWCREAMLRPGFELASPGDFAIPRVAHTHGEVMAAIRPHHAAWQRG